MNGLVSVANSSVLPTPKWLLGATVEFAFKAREVLRIWAS